MSWAALFERASEHSVTIETVSRTLDTVRARGASDDGARSEGGGTDDA